MKKFNILEEDVKRLMSDKEDLQKQNDKLRADSDYIAMMTDVELPDEEEQ